MVSSSPTENKVPRHVAIIMDGNGRWAKRRGLPRTAGHKKGLDAVKAAISSASDLGVEYLTLFGFSAENWSRPKDEVGELMRLLRFYLRAETSELHKNNIRLKIIGCRDQLDDDICELINNAEILTANNTKLNLVIALNYGGRQEILSAAMKMVHEAVEQEAEFKDRDEALAVFERHLMTAGMPEVDLLIRTSGEQRISNFLLWQCAYAEMVFLDGYWPDFNRDEFENALDVYYGRDRRFGAVSSSKGK